MDLSERDRSLLLPREKDTVLGTPFSHVAIRQEGSDYPPPTGSALWDHG
jgi:hypothetical protein